MKFEVFSDVKSGMLQQNSRKIITDCLHHFEGKRVKITIEKLKSKRSTKQNALFHLYVSILSKELGYEKEEMKNIIKFKFLLKERVVESTGEVLQYISETSKLNKSDFSDFTSELIRWSAESFGIILPLPNEQMTIKE